MSTVTKMDAISLYFWNSVSYVNYNEWLTTATYGGLLQGLDENVFDLPYGLFYLYMGSFPYISIATQVTHRR